MPPAVPGFTMVESLGANATGTTWGAVRSLDGSRCVLKIVPVSDVAEALELAAAQIALCDRIDSHHLLRQHAAIAMGDGTVALVLDEAGGGTLAQLLGARGQLTAGETVTTVAPLFKALADLHAHGVVHGDLAPGNVVFTKDGRPLIADLGVAKLLGSPANTLRPTGTGGFVAPELAHEVASSPASDVYAMAALAWFCLTGASPASAGRRPALSSLRPETPSPLVEVIAVCLSADPAARPSAGSAAVAVFDSAPAESVALAPICDPAAEITRRIRAAALAVADPAPRGLRKRHRRQREFLSSHGARLASLKSHRAPLVVVVVAFLLFGALPAGAALFSGRAPADVRPVAARSALRPSPPATSPATAPGRQPPPVPATMPATMRTVKPALVVTRNGSRSTPDVMADPRSPRLAAAGLLQSLVDARALAYVARNPALLDLVYSPGATKADGDRANITTALKNGGTYLGLSFVVRDVAFVDGSSDTARVRAIIDTPAYRTGQPDGHETPHARESLGPCVFSLTLTTDGWRIRALTVL